MVAFVLCALIGALQVVFLGVILDSAIKGKALKMLVPLLAKFFIYAIGFALIYFFCMDKIIHIGFGFIAGIVIGIVITIFINRKKQKAVSQGDGDNERCGTD